jgi:acyl-coenzyme A synthetase/AMP-(fatty) acid ligase
MYNFIFTCQSIMRSTGDIGEIDLEGNIFYAGMRLKEEFFKKGVGRADNQIKIMGKRFQLEEVEECIYASISTVNYCKVLCIYSEEKQRKILQAYIVTETGVSEGK